MTPRHPVTAAMNMLRAASLVAAVLALAACDRKSGDSTPLPNVPATVPAPTAIPAGVGPASSASATAPSSVASMAVAPTTPGSGGTSGAGSNASQSTGPANGATAVGGVAGGQAAGGAGGAKPAPTGGDGTVPK
jgi:hypothetical protein